jgi:hypothetical protein
MGKGNKRKQAVFGATPSGKKVPVSTPPPLYDHHKAAWRVSRIQIADPYGWHEMTPEEVAYLKGKLGTFEKNTWHEIFVRDARFNHCISAADLKCQVARKWMNDNMPDQDYLWTLRLTNKERIWGVLSENAYPIILWDPNHLIWEVPKK